MKSAIALAFVLLTGQATPIPKNNPNGIWQSTSGTQYQLQLSGTDLKVKLVPGTNPRFVSYEVDLKNTPDEGNTNTYLGSGAFVAKVQIQGEDKECKLETKWQLSVVSPDHILGATSDILLVPDSCDVKERQGPPNNPTAAALDLKKK